jgi:dienelactone hydrolase
LKNHTLFAPTSPPANLKLPVLVWGQSGCSYNGRRFEAFLTEVASHGIFIISNGTPDGKDNPNGIQETQNPNPALHKEAIDWITRVAGTGSYANIDTSRLAAAGQSCGGTQAYSVSSDPRVTAIGIFNSGMINANDPIPSKVTKPIFYFLGGSTDIAYANVSLAIFIHYRLV